MSRSTTKVNGGEYVVASRFRDDGDGDQLLPPKSLHIKPMRWQHWLPLGILSLVLALLPFIPLLITADDITRPCARSPPLAEETPRFREFFEIIRGYGELSFYAARLIDMCWNTVVGFGGQVLMLWAMYHVSLACLTRMIETTAVPHELYAKLMFNSPSFWSVVELMRFLFGVRSTVRRKILLGWLVLSTTWAFCWPVAANAMAGYISTGDTYIRLVNSQYLALDVFLRSEVAFRFIPPIGCSDFVARERPSEYLSVYYDPSTFQNLSIAPDRSLYSDIIDIIGSSSTPDVVEYLRDDPFNIPLLQRLSIPQDRLTKFTNCSSSVHFQDLNIEPLYVIGEEGYAKGYPFSQFPGNPVCGRESDQFQWGFSSALFWLSIIQDVWMLGVYITWIHTNRLSKSQLVRSDRGLGPYRAALDLSEAIREELGDSLSGYGDAELTSALRDRPPIKFSVGSVKEASSPHDIPIRRLRVSSRMNHSAFTLEAKDLYA